jgi:hypothetical protein
MDNDQFFPRPKDFPGNDSRVEFEDSIDRINVGDWNLGGKKCWWCGCLKIFFVDGKCPNPDCGGKVKDEQGEMPEMRIDQSRGVEGEGEN